MHALREYLEVMQVHYHFYKFKDICIAHFLNVRLDHLNGIYFLIPP